jgi:hypothetical protein
MVDPLLRTPHRWRGRLRRETAVSGSWLPWRPGRVERSRCWSSRGSASTDPAKGARESALVQGIRLARTVDEFESGSGLGANARRGPRRAGTLACRDPLSRRRSPRAAGGPNPFARPPIYGPCSTTSTINRRALTPSARGRSRRLFADPGEWLSVTHDSGPLALLTCCVGPGA